MAAKLALQPEKRLFVRWNQEVSGWFASPHELEEKSGVFVIATQGFQSPFVLDVGEAENVKFSVLNSERRTAWRRNALGGLLYAVIYTKDSGSPFLSEFHRRDIEHHIRKMEQPVFGANDIFAKPFANLTPPRV